MDFQTPQHVCTYMISLIPKGARKILEPTAGQGNLVKLLSCYSVIAPKDFYKMEKQRFDCVAMNPPFTPMSKGYEILFRCMEMSDNIVALMPYLTIINSERRTETIKEFGLKSVTHLPRSVFKGSRVQTCILQLQKGYQNETLYHFPAF